MLKSSRWWYLPKFALASSIVILWTLLVPNHSQSTDNKPLLYESELDRVLNPQALKSTSSSESTEQLRTRFANPPVDYRSMPLWVWNDELDWAHLKQQLSQFKEQGMGGVFIHPRPGLMTEYLGDEWFRLWKLSAEEGERLGIQVNIYDENSYPSGFAGGHVPQLAPDTAVQFVRADLDVKPEEVDFAEAELVSVFSVERSPDGAVREIHRVYKADDGKSGKPLLRFRLFRSAGNPWTADFPYTDLINPETTRLFIETTYEAYRKQVGEFFGNTVKWAFDDEPLLAGGIYDFASLALPLSRYILSEFQKRCQYDLADELPSLFWDVGNYRKVRFDYYQTAHDLWKENYFRTLFLWCDRNNLLFTGHGLEHEWPSPWLSPADGSFYAYEHAPGIDLLRGAEIRKNGSDPWRLFHIKQAASVSHQLGRRTLCEAYGVAGWDSTFEHYKRVGDWLMVHGIDFMDQHLSLSTIRGARKRDHPQSFSEISAWWPYYKLHGDYLGRVSYMLSRGSPANRLLVLKPTTSGFISTYRYGLTPELQTLRSTYSELMQALADHQIDFDLGDEYLLEWFGKVEGKRLAIAKTSYDLLVWPVGMVNVRHETLPILTRYLEAGGEVLALSPPADYVDGESSEEVKKLAQHFSSQWHFMDSLPNLLSGIRSRLEPRIFSDRELPNVGLSERFLENGDRILFIANIGLENVTAKVAVRGGSLEKWDLVTGETGPVPYELVDSGRLQFPLNLPLGGSEMYLVKQETLIPPLPPKPFVFSVLKPDRWQIQPDGSNVLVLDYCGLKVAGADFPNINTWGANWIIWQKHGFDRPFWDNAVQFKTRVYDRNHYPADSGFAATFRFQVDDGAVLPGLELVAEVPELYQISLNGQLLSFKESKQWLDPRLRSLSVTKWAKVGENVVRFSGQPFDVRMELENIYLKGNFNVASAEKGFRLISTRPLDLGSWAKQGWPFFSGTVHYQAELTVPQKMTRLRVQLRDWAGSVVAIDLDKKEISVLGWQPYEIEVPVIPGKHTIGIRVISNPRNLFGPFHNPTKPRMEAWPKFWAEFPEHQPPGVSYDVLNYGLFQWPVISVGMPKK